MIPDFRLEKHTGTLKTETNKQPKTKIQTCTKYLHIDVYEMLYQELDFLFTHEQIDEKEIVKIKSLNRKSYLQSNQNG